MPASWKGVIAGFIASSLLAAFFVISGKFSIFPQLDVITLIDRLGSIGRAGAWADHFIVGALLWGPIFSGIDAMTNPTPQWRKGLIFGFFGWIAMMLIFMPVVGAGLFGSNLGFIAPVGMLILHLIFGMVLGGTFQILHARFPTKELTVGQKPNFG